MTARMRSGHDDILSAGTGVPTDHGVRDDHAAMAAAVRAVKASSNSTRVRLGALVR